MGAKESKPKKTEAKKEQKKGTPIVEVPTPGKLKVLIVFANPEPKSFCGAIKDTAVNTLQKQGHQVKVSDLYQMKMFLPLDTTDFTRVEDGVYFKPQVEQASANNARFTTFTAEVREEHEKVQWCDIIIFIFPLYWWSFPGILKNWVDRIFSMGFAYGQKGNVTLKGRKGMMIYTTGGPKEFHKSIGMEDASWKMMNHGIFAFCGITPLEPFVAYQVAWIDDEARKAYLAQIAQAMEGLEKRPEFQITAT